jgi:hypothetical protein
VLFWTLVCCTFEFALVGITRFTYAFTTDKAKHLGCQASNPIRQLANTALSEYDAKLIEALEFTHCVITLYAHHQYVGRHEDDDRMYRHNFDLSLSMFWDTVKAMIEKENLTITNEQAILFDGKKPWE